MKNQELKLDSDLQKKDAEMNKNWLWIYLIQNCTIKDANSETKINRHIWCKNERIWCRFAL